MNPIRIYKKIKNRIVLQPMEGCDGTKEGAIVELTRRRYLGFAKSGAGIIRFEATGAPACVYKNSVFPHSPHGMTGMLTESDVKLYNFTQRQYGFASVDFRRNVSGSFMQVIPRFVSIDKNGVEKEFLNDYFSGTSEILENIFLKGYQWQFSFDRILYFQGLTLQSTKKSQTETSCFLTTQRTPKDMISACFQTKQKLSQL